MASLLEQLKTMTTIVAERGRFFRATRKSRKDRAGCGRGMPSKSLLEHPLPGKF